MQNLQPDFDQIRSFSALLRASSKAIAGKRKKAGPASFLCNLEGNIIEISEQLSAGVWQSSGYTRIKITKPKTRAVSAAPFKDRVVHHSLCNAIGPLFEKQFVFDSYANRVGKGTHRAILRCEQFKASHQFLLKCDIYRFFPAIDHQVLKKILFRTVTCPSTRWLIAAIIDGSNEQEKVELFFENDDLLSVAARRRGLPIGNLTSQLFANVYLNGLDHYVKEILRVKYVRYVDDFVLFGSSVEQLKNCKEAITNYLQKLRLILHPTKTFIRPSDVPLDFLGCSLMQGGWRRLQKDNVDRFTARLANIRRDWPKLDHVEKEKSVARISSWIAHAKFGHTRQLRHHLFRDGWFDPLWGDGQAVL
jgi:RNA-directed DNA polymerase